MKFQNAITFPESRRALLEGLMENMTFIQVDRPDVPSNTRFFRSHFTGKSKKEDAGTRKKKRLVAQNHADDEVRQIATKSPTVPRSSPRFLLSLLGSQPGMTTFSRDATQAYIQSSSEL